MASPSQDYDRHFNDALPAQNGLGSSLASFISRFNARPAKIRAHLESPMNDQQQMDIIDDALKNFRIRSSSDDTLNDLQDDDDFSDMDSKSRPASLIAIPQHIIHKRAHDLHLAQNAASGDLSLPSSMRSRRPSIDEIPVVEIPIPTELPPKEDLLLLLTHRLSQMHYSWRIRGPDHVPNAPEQSELLDVSNLFSSVMNVLSTLKAISFLTPPIILPPALSNRISDLSLLTTHLLRTLDTENRVPWHNLAIKTGQPTHERVELSGLVSSGHWGCVKAFGQVVGVGYLGAEGEWEEEYEEEESEGEYDDEGVGEEEGFEE